ncbi:MAG TPA: carboxymuconolactone decarboxylase family protein [Methylomirabilota bacterium]|nr:carboxymuconolactone decarboxylase family protein [Methylomirabilota bacterium]
MSKELSQDRMPPLSPEKMTEAQRKAAAELAAGPRGGVRGPFIPLLRSPELMDRLQKVGEYLRYHSALPPKLNELVVLITSREWTQQFEWAVHVPLAIKAGLKPEIVEALADGRRPSGMAEDEEIAYNLCDELFRTRGVSEPTYQRAVAKFGEQGVIDMLGLTGYFTTVAMVMNVAHTPRPDSTLAPLAPFPP